MLCAAIGYIVGGLLCDRFGVFSSLLLGTFLSAVPTLFVPPFGHSYHSVLFLRFLQGFAPGLVVVCAPKVAALWFPPERRGLATALPPTGISIGTLIALVGAPVIFPSAGTWQNTALRLSIISWVALVFVLVLRFAPKPAIPGEEFAGAQGRFKPAFRLPILYIGFVVVFFSSWTLQSVFDLTPSYLALDIGLGFGRLAAGQLMGIVTIAGIIGPIIGGLLIDKVFRGSARPVILGGFGLTAVLFFALQFPVVHAARPTLVVDLFLLGVGVTVLYPAVFEFVSRSFPAYMAGTIIGLWMGLGNLGGATGLFLDGALLNRFPSYHPAITAVAIAAAVAFVISFWMKKPDHLAVAVPDAPMAANKLL
jgi:MFS family permease